MRDPPVLVRRSDPVYEFTHYNLLLLAASWRHHVRDPPILVRKPDPAYEFGEGVAAVLSPSLASEARSK